MNNKKQTFLVMGIVSVIAGAGMLSTALAALADTNVNSNGNDNTNTVRVGSRPVHLAQATLPQQYYPQPPYYGQPPYPQSYPQSQAPIPPPVPQPDYQYQYVAPGIPNAGFGDMGMRNLLTLIGSGIVASAGGLYLRRSAAYIR
jgi:hypothetical protein